MVHCRSQIKLHAHEKQSRRNENHGTQGEKVEAGKGSRHERKSRTSRMRRRFWAEEAYIAGYRDSSLQNRERGGRRRRLRKEWVVGLLSLSGSWIAEEGAQAEGRLYSFQAQKLNLISNINLFSLCPVPLLLLRSLSSSSIGRCCAPFLSYGT